MPKSLSSKPNLSEQKSLTYSQPSRRPWRVVPLAIGAVALVCGTAAAALELSRGISGDRYAVEILKDELHRIV